MDILDEFAPVGKIERSAVHNMKISRGMQLAQSCNTDVPLADYSRVIEGLDRVSEQLTERLWARRR